MTKARLIGLMVGVLLFLAVAPVANAHGIVGLRGADGCPSGPRPDSMYSWHR